MGNWRIDFGGPDRRGSGLVLKACAAVVAVLACWPASARADLVAFTEVRGAAGDADIARIVIASGHGNPVPSGLNTPAEELHPSISPDGFTLAFERIDPAAGTRRIVITDLASGTSADLYNAFDAATQAPNTPTWTSPTTVAVGAPTAPLTVGQSQAQVSSIDISDFPGGPFPRSTVVIGAQQLGGNTLQFEQRVIAATKQRIRIAGLRPAGGVTGRLVEAASGPAQVLSGSDSFDDPTISTSQSVIVADDSKVKDGALQGGRLFFTSLLLAGITPLPAIVNAAGTSVERPEFSDDGRYLAFVRRGGDGHYRLFVWDTQTQLLLDPDGADLGLVPDQAALERSDGAIALHDLPIILSSSIAPNGLIVAGLQGPSNVGIIVQRIVGRTRVLGRSAPRLHFVGRVPLGHFKRGRARIHWDRRVGGRTLSPGRYQVTVRSVTAAGGVRDLGKPVTLRIR
jgi:hypothetical protein